MEKADYRDNLERLSKRFSGELIPFLEVCEYLGTTSKVLNADKTFPKKKIGGRYFVTVVALAKWLS